MTETKIPFRIKKFPYDKKEKTTHGAKNDRRENGNYEKDSKNAEKVGKVSAHSRVPDEGEDHKKVSRGQI